MSYLSSTNEKTRPAQDEGLLCQKIHTHISATSAKDAEKFNEAYAKLRNTVSKTSICYDLNIEKIKDNDILYIDRPYSNNSVI